MPITVYQEIIPFVETYIPDKLRIKFKVKRLTETQSIRIRIRDQYNVVVAEDIEDIDISYIPLGDVGTIERMLSIENAPTCVQGTATKVTDLVAGTKSFEGKDLHWYLIAVRGKVAAFTVTIGSTGEKHTHNLIDVDGDGYGIIAVILRVSGSETITVELAENQFGAVYDLGTELELQDTILYLDVIEKPQSGEYIQATSYSISCIKAIALVAAPAVGLGELTIMFVIHEWRPGTTLTLVEAKRFGLYTFMDIVYVSEPIMDIYVGTASL